MRFPAILPVLAVVACICIAGCTQTAVTSPAATTVPPEATMPAEPVAPVATVPETSEQIPVVMATPEEVVTIVHQISLTKDVKDSQLLYSLQVPVEWSPVTYRIENPENFEGTMYQTDLLKNDTFYIHTFTNYRSREQNYHDECLRWSPAPNMTVVTINGIMFERFESTANGKTNVTYVPVKNTMNDFGYLSVLAFTADTSNRFAVEDYDRVVASFRFWSREQIASMPGEEITRLLPDQDGGSVRSAVKSSSGAVSRSSSSGSTCGRR